MLQRASLVFVPVLALASMAQAATVLMDFGVGTSTGTVAGRTWNNIGGNTGDAAPYALTDVDGNASGMSIQMSNITARPDAGIGFNDGSTNTQGLATPVGEALARGYPASATGDSQHGNTTLWNGFICPDLRMTLSGLDSNFSYDLYFFAYRQSGSSTDHRETVFDVEGLTGSGIVSLDVTQNAAGDVVSVMGVTPNAGTITVDLYPGANNNNSYKFYYLGVMEVVSTPVPEPASLGLLGLAGLALIRRRR